MCLLGCGLLWAVRLYGHHPVRLRCCIGATLGWHHGYVMAVLWLCYGYVVAAATAAASERREAVFGCCASQERINMSAVPTAPRVFFQPLSLSLTCPGFSKQYRQCE